MPEDAIFIPPILVVAILVVAFIPILALGAAFLLLAAKWVQKVSVSFFSALLTVLLALVVHLGAAATVSYLLVWLFPDALLIRFLRIPVIHGIGFFLQAAIIGWRLQITYGRACLVTLVYFGLWMPVLAVCIAILIFLAFFSMSSPAGFIASP